MVFVCVHFTLNDFSDNITSLICMVFVRLYITLIRLTRHTIARQKNSKNNGYLVRQVVFIKLIFINRVPYGYKLGDIKDTFS